MKRFLLFSLLFVALSGYAQPADSSIFQLLQSDGRVTIKQSRQIEEAVNNNIRNNAYKKSKGYRIRIFFDNDQKARQNSFAIARSFAVAYPQVAVYHSYEELYFRVVVGDFRTKSDAMRFLETIKSSYPAALIVADRVNLPKAQQEQERIRVEEEPEEEQ